MDFNTKKAERLKKAENALNATLGRLGKARQYSPVTPAETDWHNANLNRLGFTVKMQEAKIEEIKADFETVKASDNPEYVKLKNEIKAMRESLKYMVDAKKAMVKSL